MKALLGAALAAALSVVAAAAAADTVTFEGLTPGAVPASFTEGAFTVDYTNLNPGGFAVVGSPAPCSPVCATNGTQTVASFNAGAFSLHRTDNALFDFVSFDAAQTFTSFNRALNLFVTATYADNSTFTAQFTTAAGGADTFSTFLASNAFTNVAKVTLQGGPTYPDQEFSLDNLVTGGGGAVPEPGTWALMILGFGAAGATLRTRRQAPIRV